VKKLNFLVLIFALMINMPAMAFSSDDERIDNYLSVLSVGSKKEKKTMLNRLQWSGLSDPRLFDEIESHVKAWESNIDSDWSNHDGVLPFYIRALGFSGNEKYRATIVKLYDNPHAANVRKYSKRALRDLGRFGNWNEQIKQSDVVVEGNLLRQVRADKFVFSDGSGEVMVELDDDIQLNTPIDHTTKVRLFGEFEGGNKPEIEVEQLVVM